MLAPEANYISSIELSAQEKTCSNECPHCPNWDRKGISTIEQFHPDVIASLILAQDIIKKKQRERVRLVFLNSPSDFADSIQIPDIDLGILSDITIFLRSREDNFSLIQSKLRSFFGQIRGKDNSITLDISRNISHDYLADGFLSGLAEDVRGLMGIMDHMAHEIEYFKEDDSYIQYLGHRLTNDQLEQLFLQRGEITAALEKCVQEIIDDRLDVRNVEHRNRCIYAMNKGSMSYYDTIVSKNKIVFEVALRLMSRRELTDQEIAHQFFNIPARLSIHPTHIVVNHTPHTINDRRLQLTHSEFQEIASLCLQNGMSFKQAFMIVKAGQQEANLPHTPLPATAKL